MRAQAAFSSAGLDNPPGVGEIAARMTDDLNPKAASGRVARSIAAALAAGLLAFFALAGIMGARGADPVKDGSAEDSRLAPDVGHLTDVAPQGYVGSRACAGCHAAEFGAWTSSHHAKAMMAATPQTVLGDFSGVSASHFGATARFFRDGDRFLVETQGEDGKPETFQVSDTFGLTPLQQYLVTFPDGRRQVLPWAWDARPKADGGQRWIHVYAQDIKPGDPLFWTGALQTWNHQCAECHSTALTKGYDLAANSYHTTFSEVSIGCESCHGPGAGHLAWAKASPHPDAPLKGFSAAFAPRPPVDFTPDPKTGSPTASVAHPKGDVVELCARCHSRRGLLSEDWHPGHPLLDTHAPSFLSQGLFEADGQMRDEVFNDQSFKQSKMYAKGVVCTDCHNPHSGQLKAEGAQVCAQCHLPERFASREHTGHAPGPGAPDCISCHMPARTYMRVDVRHDHSFRIPRPDLSAKLGTPNTCNACHQDKSAQWAAEAIARWHGPERKGFQTWADAFHEARVGDPAAREKLIAIAKDEKVPAVARATALDELARFPSRASIAALSQGLTDVDPVVRLAALRALLDAPPDERWRLAGPLIDDPVLAVRLAATRAVADKTPDGLSEADGKRLEAAFAAYEAELKLNADRPEGRANLATFYLLRRDLDGAERELLAGLALDPGSAELAVNLADLYRHRGEEGKADQVLRAALAKATEPAALHHALGLSLVRQKRMDEAVSELADAARLAPSDARFAYVYIVALRSTGQMDKARAALKEALSRHPYNVNLLTLALNDALSRGKLAEATDFAARIVRMRPEDWEMAGLLAKLRAAAAPR